MCAWLHLCEPLPETFMNHLSPDRQLAFLVCNHISDRCCLWINHCLILNVFSYLRPSYGQISPTIKAGSTCSVLKEGDIWGQPGIWNPESGIDTSPQVWSLVFLKFWRQWYLLSGYAKSQLGFWKKWADYFAWKEFLPSSWGHLAFIRPYLLCCLCWAMRVLLTVWNLLPLWPLLYGDLYSVLHQICL